MDMEDKPYTANHLLERLDEVILSEDAVAAIAAVVKERALDMTPERPSRRELLDAIRQQPEVSLDPSPADVLRAERDSRGDLHERNR